MSAAHAALAFGGPKKQIVVEETKGDEKGSSVSLDSPSKKSDTPLNITSPEGKTSSSPKSSKKKKW